MLLSSVRIYCSGWQATTTERESRVIQSGYLKHRCFSFCNLEKLPGIGVIKGAQEAYKVCVENKIGIMMDSGVFSYRTYKANYIKQGKPLTELPTEEQFIDLYVAYCKQYSHLWDFYVTIDLEINAPKILHTHIKLEKLGLRPMPVFHGDDSVDYLKKYADKGYKLIGIGLARSERGQRDKLRNRFDTIFDEGAKLGLDFHGLALTSGWVMLGWPWWSVDSSSWSRTASLGCICRFDHVKHRMSVLHISEVPSTHKPSIMDLSTRQVEGIKKEIESEGFDYEELRKDFVARHIYNARTMSLLADLAGKRSKNNWNLLF